MTTNDYRPVSRDPRLWRRLAAELPRPQLVTGALGLVVLWLGVPFAPFLACLGAGMILASVLGLALEMIGL